MLSILLTLTFIVNNSFFFVFLATMAHLRCNIVTPIKGASSDFSTNNDPHEKHEI